MTKQMLVMIVVPMLVSTGLAQNVDVDVEKQSSSRKVIVVNKNGKTYRKVIENGKVVEETGNPDLLKDVHIDVNVDVDVGGDVRGNKAKKSRRVIRKSGKKILDETLGGLDLPKKIRDLLDRVHEGTFDFDFDFDFGPGHGSKSKSRRVVIVNGEKVIDEATDGDDPEDLFRGLGRHPLRGRRGLESLEDMQRELEELQGRIRELQQRMEKLSGEKAAPKDDEDVRPRHRRLRKTVR